MKASQNKKTRNLEVLKPGSRNPRRISDARREALRASLLEFGDLSGVILNVRSGELVGANQRVSIFRQVGGHVAITERLTRPDKRGTIARGYVVVDGEKFSYREVSWSMPRQRAANLAANKHGGEFVEEEVRAIIAELAERDRSLTGFDAGELAALLDEVEADLQPLPIQPPPKMAWVLIGVPLVKFSAIAPHIEALAKIPDVRIESTFNDNEQKPAEEIAPPTSAEKCPRHKRVTLCEQRN